jgi:hypothetical protein
VKAMFTGSSEPKLKITNDTSVCCRTLSVRGRGQGKSALSALWHSLMAF